MKNTEKEKLLFLVRAAVFAVIFFILFLGINQVFLYKDLNFYNYRNFVNQPEDSIHLLVMGSSHSIDAVDSVALEENLMGYGLQANVFNMSITGMRMEQIAYRFEEALKTQKPRILVVETFSLAPMEEMDSETVRRYALDYMPLTREKFGFISDNIMENSGSFYVPFIKYHTRWSELTADDFCALSSRWLNTVSASFGKIAESKPEYAGQWDAYFEQDFTSVTEAEEPDAATRRHVERIIGLAAENNVKVLFLSVPYKIQMEFPNTELMKYNNYLKEHYVDDESVFLLDMNPQIGELDWGYRYMQDDGHVNDKGRKVVIDCLSRFISEKLKSSLGEREGGI